MKRIILLVFLGASLVSISMAQGLARDSTSRPDTAQSPIVSDTVKKASVDNDTLLKRTADSLAAQKDITAHVAAAAGDTGTVRKDTTAHEASAARDTSAVPKEVILQDTTAKKTANPVLRSLSPNVESIDPKGYRDARWGMTLKDVHDYIVDHDNVDEYDILDLANGFEYTGSLAGVKCKIAYQFDNDRLFIARLTPQVKATTKFDYLDSFDDYASTLESKYGKPTRSGFHKVDDSYLNTIESIQLGFAKKYSLWEFERSYIVLVLLGHKGQLEIHLTYLSRAIFDEMSNRIESLRLEDF